MSERMPSGDRFFDFQAARWNWSGDITAESSPWVDADDSEMSTVDFDAIPTLEELEAGAEPGPEISLVDHPHAIALPDIYEPGYRYPLIVWFHEPGGTEDDIFSILPMISERNYLAIAIRGNLTHGAGAEWSMPGHVGESLQEQLDRAIERLDQQFPIHRERVYLAGVGSGGTTALHLLLESPESYAGAACLNGSFPNLAHPLAKFRGLRGRRVLLSSTAECEDVRIVDLVAAGRLMYSAGVQVGTRVYQQQDTTPTTKMLRDLNHWIMDGIASSTGVSAR